MFVKRYLFLWLILFQTAAVAEIYGRDNDSLAYYEKSGQSPFIPPRGWLPDRMGFNMPERFRRDQDEIEPRAVNPWALPVSQWVSTMPQYLGSEFREPGFGKNDYSQMPQYGEQTGEQNTASLSFYSAPGFHFSEQPNSPVSSQQPYAESIWHQPPGVQPAPPNVPAPAVTMHHFQKHPRFVTPEILEALNRPQVQNKKNFQQKSWCCQNHQHRINNQTYPQANRQHDKQMDRYSNGLMMPFTMDAGQLNKERLLYMGDSLPTVPDAAIGGLPPMNIFEPLPPVLSGSGDGIDWGMNRFGIGPYGDFLQR